MAQLSQSGGQRITGHLPRSQLDGPAKGHLHPRAFLFRGSPAYVPQTCHQPGVHECRTRRNIAVSLWSEEPVNADPHQSREHRPGSHSYRAHSSAVQHRRPNYSSGPGGAALNYDPALAIYRNIQRASAPLKQFRRALSSCLKPFAMSGRNGNLIIASKMDRPLSKGRHLAALCEGTGPGKSNRCAAAFRT